MQRLRASSNEGWVGRIGKRTGESAAVGGLAGLLFSLSRNVPAAPAVGATAASFGIVAATFCSLQELCRLLRRDDDYPNSLCAGAATGALLRGLHHGRRFALPGALVGGAVCCFSHLALEAHTRGDVAAAVAPAWALVQHYSPLQRLSDEEVARREAKHGARLSSFTSIAREERPQDKQAR